MKWFSQTAFLVLTLALFVKGAGAWADEAPTLENLIGIPVMAGLEEDLDQRIIFDKSEGRIVHVVLGGDAPPPEALGFYKEALFQLGWQLANTQGGGALMFSREQEFLTLTVTSEAPLKLEFDLKPAS